MPTVISLFEDTYRWLSNFWLVSVCYEGMYFPTVEHAYQAAKTLDPDERKLIQIASTPGKAKRRGRDVTLRSDWESIKLDVMYGLLVQKFSQPDLREKLKATGDMELMEDNVWGNTYWGVCRGKGENHLGKLLMRVRKEIQ